MEKIGEYIPLIIIAISLIYSFAKKAGKKANGEEETGKMTLPNGLPQRERETFFEPVKVQPEPQPVVRPQKPNKKQQEIAETSFNKNEKQSPVLIEEITDNAGISFDFNNMDELKKGIVYAEIFNRKY